MTPRGPGAAVTALVQGAAVTALALHALVQGAAHAQVVYGRVVADVERTPLATATVTMRSAADASVQLSAVANDSGGFRMVVPRPGEYLLEASLVGYATLAPARVSVAAGEGVQVEVRLARDAIALEPVIVVARRSDVAQDATFEGALARHAAFPSHGTRRWSARRTRRARWWRCGRGRVCSRS